MPDAFAMNKKRLQAVKEAKDYKNRRGGISNDAWQDLSKSEKADMQADGLMPSMNIHGMASPGERDKFISNQEKWENAAYEHGGVSSSNDLRDLHSAFKETGIKKMDSFQDGRAFRRAHNDFDDKRFKAIEGRLDGMGNKTSEPKEETKEADPVTSSQHLARAKAYVSAKDETDLKGETTAQKTGFNPVSGAAGFGSSFMDRYKEGVKKNLEPTNVSSKLANEAKNFK